MLFLGALWVLCGKAIVQKSITTEGTEKSKGNTCPDDALYTQFILMSVPGRLFTLFRAMQEAAPTVLTVRSAALSSAGGVGASSRGDLLFFLGDLWVLCGKAIVQKNITTEGTEKSKGNTCPDDALYIQFILMSVPGRLFTLFRAMQEAAPT